MSITTLTSKESLKGWGNFHSEDVKHKKLLTYCFI